MDPSTTEIILGPPGTGKTTDLVGIVEKALESGIKPHRIAMLSFTKKGAEVGLAKAVEKFGMSEDQFPFFRTTHSLAFRHIEMRRDQVFGWSHLKELGKILGLDFKGRGDLAEDDVYGMNDADRLLFLEGLSRNTNRSLKETWSDAMEDSIDWRELERFAEALRRFKESRHLLDYPDMIKKMYESHIDSYPELDVCLLDEGQDLSNAGWQLFEKFASKAKRTYIAGDDDQCIYNWAGSNVSRFIDLKGRVRVLGTSHRVPVSVHKLSEGIVSRISYRREKLWQPRQELGAINWYQSIEEVDLSKDTWLLLARNGYMLDEMEEYCMSQGFSFHSINRDPLKSHALNAVRIWENLRRGAQVSVEEVIKVSRFMENKVFPKSLLDLIGKFGQKHMTNMVELTTLGLRSQAIWHQALTKISPKERDFFIAARKRGEALLKEPRIKISTIHAAKGGEADHVLLLTDMSFRCYTNMQNNLDDEVRVWYVAATRCRKTLNIVSPQTNLNFEIG